MAKKTLHSEVSSDSKSEPNWSSELAPSGDVVPMAVSGAPIPEGTSEPASCGDLVPMNVPAAQSQKLVPMHVPVAPIPKSQKRLQNAVAAMMKKSAADRNRSPKKILRSEESSDSKSEPNWSSEPRSSKETWRSEESSDARREANWNSEPRGSKETRRTEENSDSMSEPNWDSEPISYGADQIMTPIPEDTSEPASPTSVSAAQSGKTMQNAMSAMVKLAATDTNRSSKETWRSEESSPGSCGGLVPMNVPVAPTPKSRRTIENAIAAMMKGAAADRSRRKK